jgi:hypothetical protein
MLEADPVGECDGRHVERKFSKAMNLTDDDIATIVRLLRGTIAADPYPLSPRIKRLKAILAKLDWSAASEERPKPLPSPVPRPVYKPSVLARRLRDGRI